MTLSDPLASDEVYLRVELDIASDLARRASEESIRLSALRRVWDEATQHGYIVTRGPEIIAFHRPEYPGDTAYVVALGVGCSV